MSRTFFDQDTQIRNSFVYVDNNAPASTMESGAANLEDDLNNVRSVLSLLRDTQTGNWYDDLVAPSTFENGARRGVQDNNQSLHDLERKRVLVQVFNLNDVPVGTLATGTLTATLNFSNGETVTTGSKAYTFQTVLTNVDGNVLIGASLAASLANLAAAINLDAGAGSLYAAATTINTFVTATSTSTTLVVAAKHGGVAGNSVATTDTAANAAWGSATLAGGVNTNVAVLALSAQLPSNPVAAIGAVTTRGTVAAAQGGVFGAHSLAAVTGANALSPKNLVPVVDSITHDPILSSNRIVWALFQTESTTDGSTITTSTPNRAQLSFVRQNGAGNALEAAPAADLAGMIIHFSAIERKALQDLNEQDFLKGSTVDVPAATTVTRQVAYDNQGTTPVELTSNATLDLNSASEFWEIRDLVNATLFRITEGSTGGTSTVQVAPDVDLLDVGAAVNSFASGLRAATGTERINVGETAGVIESTGANDLRLLGASHLRLDDSFQPGSTWVGTDGVALANTSAEWSAFKASFGEVSLLNAINQAYTQGNEIKTYARVTGNVNADVDVSLADGNLDVALPDMSTGSFLNDYDVFLNGQLMRPGANSGANHDYYPGTTLATAAKLKFEFKLHTNDQLCVVKKIA